MVRRSVPPGLAQALDALRHLTESLTAGLPGGSCADALAGVDGVATRTGFDRLVRRVLRSALEAATARAEVRPRPVVRSR
jgi:hypothetical protein